MNYLTFLLFILMISVSCSSFQNNSETNENKDSLVTKKELLPVTNDSTFKPPFWIISVGAYELADSASAAVEKLKAEGKEAGYLWIPDYSTLSNKKMYTVFLGPFYNEIDAGRTLMPYIKEHPGAYAVKADHTGSRYSLHGPFDIRKDDKKMNMVIIYSTPEDEKTYAEEGGEDWGWFINDVGEYMAKEMPDAYYGVSLYDSWFSDEEIKSIETELELDGFGYIMIKGNEKSFTPHDTPNSVISSICEFFGKEFNENWNNNGQ